LVHNTNIKLIFLGPGDNVEGGIPAVIKGLEKCFEIKKKDISYKRLVYGKERRDMSKLSRIATEFLQVFTFISTLFAYKPTIIHAQTSLDKKTILRDSLYLFISTIFRKKFILHVHGGQWEMLTEANGLWKFSAKRFLKKCDLVIVTSTEELNWIKSNYGEIINVDLLNNVVELDFDVNKFRKKRIDKTEIKKIIFASRLIESKGILDLIESINLLETRSDFQLDIYGGGPLKKEIEKKILALKLEDKINFKGEVDFDKLLKEYCEGDIFAFPSYHHEGFPMAFFFAVACGLAIVTSEVRPIPFFLKEKENCLYVEQKNSKSLSIGLSKLLNNDALIEEMSLNNINLIKQFSSQEISSQLLRIYNIILNNESK